MKVAALLDRVRAPSVPSRMAGAAGLVLLASAAVLLLPDALSAGLAQSLLLAAVLAGGALLGLGPGLVAATVGFGTLLWRAVDAGEGGWVLDGQSALGAFLWFAVAKLGVALIAGPRSLVGRLSDAKVAAEAAARRQALLLSEMSHRIGNDLSALTAMLQLQAATEPDAAGALDAAAGRVMVLSRVYRRLSRAKAVDGDVRGEATVDSRPFLEELVTDLRAGLGELRPVMLTVSAEAHALPLRRASDVGLVVNELVTNALKHAFPGGRRGVVRVSFRRDGDVFELAVSDNGVGAASEPGPRREGGGLGNQILQALAAQLGGRLDVARGEVGGSQCRLRFPAPSAGAAGPDAAAGPSSPSDPGVAARRDRARTRR